jgi:hypothetical protein
MRTDGQPRGGPSVRLFFRNDSGLYSSSPSSSPTVEGATPPSIGGTSLGGSTLGAAAEGARRALGADGFFSAFRALLAGFFLPFGLPGAFFALFFERLAALRFVDRFATLPAAFFAGFFAVFRFVAIVPSYRPASPGRSNDVARLIWPRIVNVKRKRRPLTLDDRS